MNQDEDTSSTASVNNNDNISCKKIPKHYDCNNKDGDTNLSKSVYNDISMYVKLLKYCDYDNKDKETIFNKSVYNNDISSCQKLPKHYDLKVKITKTL